MNGNQSHLTNHFNVQSEKVITYISVKLCFPSTLHKGCLYERTWRLYAPGPAHGIRNGFDDNLDIESSMSLLSRTVAHQFLLHTSLSLHIFTYALKGNTQHPFFLTLV